MLYLVLSPSCISQMELVYLMNCSPDFFGEQPHNENWATYEINGETVDGENGYFGTVRVHDDYWNIDDEDRAWYNFEVRNSLRLSKAQFYGLTNLIPKYKNIALLLHAQNVEDIWDWSQQLDIKVVGAYMGTWSNNLEYWAMREFNDVMTDDANANYSDHEHRMLSIEHVVESFQHRSRADQEWWQMCLGSTHYTVSQETWQRLEYLPLVYERCQIAKPKVKWMKDYFTSFQSRQEYNVDRLTKLRNAYDRR